MRRGKRRAVLPRYDLLTVAGGGLAAGVALTLLRTDLARALPCGSRCLARTGADRQRHCTSLAKAAAGISAVDPPCAQVARFTAGRISSEDLQQRPPSAYIRSGVPEQPEVASDPK